LNEEPLYLHLKIWGKQINAVPLRKIYTTEIQPDLLALRSINRAHT
jgi:hypothetical protein